MQKSSLQFLIKLFQDQSTEKMKPKNAIAQYHKKDNKLKLMPQREYLNRTSPPPILSDQS